MAKNGGGAAHKRTGGVKNEKQVTEKFKSSTISFSLSKRAVQQIGSVKKWEEKSESRPLALRGRR